MDDLINQCVRSLNYNLRNLLSLLSHSRKYSFQRHLHFLHINDQWFRASRKWKENNFSFSNACANNSYLSLYSILCWLIPIASERDWQLLNESAVKCISLVTSNEGENILSHIYSTAQCDPSLYIKISKMWQYLTWRPKISLS